MHGLKSWGDGLSSFGVDGGKADFRKSYERKIRLSLLRNLDAYRFHIKFR